MTWTLALSNLENIPADTRPICKHCGVRFTITSPFANKQEYCCTECRQEDRDRQRRFNSERKPLEKCGPVQRKFRNRAEYFRNLMANYERTENDALQILDGIRRRRAGT